jgi:hypothetical protein
MKNQFLNSFYMFILSFTLFSILGNPVHSQTTLSHKVDYLYPANKEKVFDETVDEFYQALRDIKYPVHQEFFQMYENRQRDLDTVLFREIPDASVNIRKKVLFNEVEKINYITWDANIHTTYPDLDINYHQAVSPNRQIYFFFSFKDTEEEFRGRYAIYDVETKKILAGGGNYIPKYLTYKKHLINKNEFEPEK